MNSCNRQASRKVHAPRLQPSLSPSSHLMLLCHWRAQTTSLHTRSIAVLTQSMAVLCCSGTCSATTASWRLSGLRRSAPSAARAPHSKMSRRFSPTERQTALAATAAAAGRSSRSPPCCRQLWVSSNMQQQWPAAQHRTLQHPHPVRHASGLCGACGSSSSCSRGGNGGTVTWNASCAGFVRRRCWAAAVGAGLDTGFCIRCRWLSCWLLAWGRSVCLHGGDMCVVGCRGMTSVVSQTLMTDGCSQANLL